MYEILSINYRANRQDAHCQVKRVILNIIEKNDDQGLIKPGSVLVEATSRKAMGLFGAELVLTPASERTAGTRKHLIADMEKT